MTRACANEDVDGPPSPLPHNSYLGDQRNYPFLHVSRRLPAELLAFIFIHIARDSYIEKQYINCLNSTGPSCVNVSYVCRYWRDVALNCPTLWSFVTATSQRWTQELLARSQMVPLKINIEVHNTMLLNILITRQQIKVRVRSIVKQVVNHSQRIQKLCLTASIVSQEAEYHYLYQDLFKFLSTHLPCLQHLDIGLRLSGEEILATLRRKHSSSSYAEVTSVLCTMVYTRAKFPNDPPSVRCWSLRTHNSGLPCHAASYATPRTIICLPLPSECP
jgi:hypothetical protein